jgi:exosortase
LRPEFIHAPRGTHLTIDQPEPGAVASPIAMLDSFDTLHQQVFLGCVVLLFALEQVNALRRDALQSSERWVANVGLFLLGNFVSRIVVPIGIVALASSQPPGTLARAGLPLAAQTVLGFLILDVLSYGVHRLLHSHSLLWRLHLVHHSDIRVDLTTAERHHPFEVLLNPSIKVTVVVLLGLPAQAVAGYELITAVMTCWTHANLRLPIKVDRAINRLVVTPGMHLIHHSSQPAQTNSNYGNILSVWDRAFGTCLSPATHRVERLGLEYFRTPRDNSLAGVLLQPFRRHTGWPAVAHPGTGSAEVPAAPAPASISAEWNRALRSAAVGCALVAIVMAPTAIELGALWKRIEAYRYAWLVLPMLVYLLGWHRRDEILAMRPVPSGYGVVIALGAAVLWSVASLMNIDVGRQFALITAVHGVALAALGWNVYRRLFPALALLFLMVPSGDVLQPALRFITIQGLDLTLSWTGVPHKVEGFSLAIGPHHYVVADACSGLAHVTLMTFLGWCFGLLLYRSMFKVAALALIGGLMGIASNLLRVNAIVFIDRAHGSQMQLADHGNIQWLALAVALGLMLLWLSRMQPEALPASTQDTPPIGAARQVNPGSNGRRCPAAVLAGLVVMCIAGVTAGFTSRPAWAAVQLPSGQLPSEIAGWRLSGPVQAQATSPAQDTTTQTLLYRRQGRDLRVTVTQTRSIQAKLSEEALSPGTHATWQDIRRDTPTDCSTIGCAGLRHTVWRLDKKTPLRHVYHAYSVADFDTDSKLALRAATAWHRLMGQAVGARLIVMAIDGDEPTREDMTTLYHAIRVALNESPAAAEHAP